MDELRTYKWRLGWSCGSLSAELRSEKSLMERKTQPENCMKGQIYAWLKYRNTWNIVSFHVSLIRMTKLSPPLIRAIINGKIIFLVDCANQKLTKILGVQDIVIRDWNLDHKIKWHLIQNFLKTMKRHCAFSGKILMREYFLMPKTVIQFFIRKLFKVTHKGYLIKL